MNQLTEQEIQAIKDEAEKLYPYHFDEGEREYVYEQRERKAYIAALTSERQKVKGLLEDGWISVKDRLPEIPKPYYNKEYKTMMIPQNINVLVYDGENVSMESYGIINWGEEITHWQPLPKAPPNTEQLKNKL